MPEKMERMLKAKAREKFGSVTSKRARAYVYGTMRKAGWKPSREKKSGGMRRTSHGLYKG